MSEALMEYLLETEVDENVIWSALDAFNGMISEKDLNDMEVDYDV